MNKYSTNHFRQTGRIFKRLSVLILLLTVTSGAFAQKAKDKPFVVEGVVTNAGGAPLQGVLVDLKESLTFVLTGADGKFSITVPKRNSGLVFSIVGYKPATVVVADEKSLNVMLVAEDLVKDRMISIIYGQQKQSLITSAVSTIDGEQIQDKPTMFQSTALAGMLPGLFVELNNGSPGNDHSTVAVRGYRSWNHTAPMVMVDGYEREISSLNPYEIAQVSVFKDAGATAILGLRGSNGALMATTRRGTEGRPILKFNSQFSFQQPVVMPKFVNSSQFAQLYNEAQINDGAVPKYTEADSLLYISGESPYTHPNVDWVGETMKNMTTAQRYNLSLEGGSSAAKYFVNMSYQNNDGIYNTDKSASSYNTNANSQIYTIRSNVDIALTRTMDLSVDLFGRQSTKREPGSNANVFNVIYSLPPNIFPYNYGSDKPAGTPDNRVNPFGVLNHSGYSLENHSTMEASAKLNQRLDVITKGLSAFGSMAFDGRFSNSINRSKSYKVYEYIGLDADGNELFNSYGDITKQNNSNTFGANKVRNFDLRAGLGYDRAFGAHNIAAMTFFEYLNQSTDSQRLPNLHQGIFGRATYHYDARYIAEFSFGWQGTEQLPEHNRYGFFPAASVGWILSNEKFIRDNPIGKTLNFVKFRGSHGLTGNMGGMGYFYYMPAFVRTSTTYSFGTTPTNNATWAESTSSLYNLNAIWEETLKTNIGTDMALFGNFVNLSFDVFQEKTSQIRNTMSSISTLYGIGTGNAPSAFVGKAENRGFEGQLALSGQMRDFTWSVGGIYSFARSKITFMDEQSYEDEYRRQQGDPLYSQYGHVVTGIYVNEQDRYNSPKTDFGNSAAGDLKYRDLNGNGLVDKSDMERIGQGGLGEINYSLFANAMFKGFDFHIMFTGRGNKNVYYQAGAGGIGVVTHAFYNAAGTSDLYGGTTTQYVWDNRYNPRDESTWATAKYPKLTVNGSSHNYNQSSNFFLYDGSFIRLKSLVVGYTIPQRLTQKISMSKVRLAYSGYNLFTWDKMEMDMDPETGRGYPTMKTSSFILTIHF